MNDTSNEEIVSLAALQRKIDLTSVQSGVSPTDMEDFEKGLAGLDNAGFLMLKLAANSQDGKPFTLTSDSPKTIERCRAFAEHLGVSVDEVDLDDGFTRLLVGASFKRFVMNDDGNILDTLNRLPTVPACNCESCRGRDRTELHRQVYLRRCVLRTQLSVLSEKVEFLCEPEAHSLADIIYWTIYVCKLDWTIGHFAVLRTVEGGGDQASDALADRLSLSPFLHEVGHLLRDLYSDCDQDLLNDLFESIQVIVCQWDCARTASSRREDARTASSRSVLDRLSEGMNAPRAFTEPSSNSSSPNATVADGDGDLKTR